mgnify:CR=1 FL=1
MYQVSERVKKQFEYTMSIPCVKEAMKFIQEDERNTIEEQKELVLIEAPTGEEEKRAAVMMEKFKALGLENVHIDRGGNVVGLRRGSGKGPKVLIEGHLDTVFPFGTVHGVEERDGFLYAPGIGDDTRALAMLLGLLRALNQNEIKTFGDIVFVATTREEGMGGLGGMKDFLNDNDDIDISLTIDNNDMSALIFEATSGETYEVNFYGIGGHAFGSFGEMAQPEQLRRSLILQFHQIRRQASVSQISTVELRLECMRSHRRQPSNLISDQIHRRSLQSFAQKSLMRSKKHAGKKQKNGEKMRSPGIKT